MVLRIISKWDFDYKRERHRIDSDMVPNISEKIHTERSFRESVLQPQKSEVEEKITQHAVPFRVQTKQNIQKIDQENQPQTIQPGYGRLTPMINDLSISHITVGQNNQVKIIKRGREQSINIILTQDEMNSILQYLSEKSRIPLTTTEGVFRVTVDNMLFNAIISKELGTTLMIKKNFQPSPDLREAFQQ
jgi:Flp pilus assembly CpaF family ATPase